ncbi:MAG TPA: hypothetical protein VHP11_17945 [Tepidisphaeraceae bacterium]|nr:hypothetical protein [Tepidisphaeraceae bacterium]
MRASATRLTFAPLVATLPSSDLPSDCFDALEKQYRSDNDRIASNSALKREYERRRQILQSNLEVLQQRLTACRKQIDYVKNNMQ